MNQTTNPLTTLATAEKALITNLHGLAIALDKVGTSPLQQAQARVQASAAAAAQRLQNGLAASLADVLGVAALMGEMSVMLQADARESQMIDLSDDVMIDLSGVDPCLPEAPLPAPLPGEQMIDLREPPPVRKSRKR